MKAENLQDLIRRSSSTRQYFMSLPVPDQMELHRYNEHVKTADQLHRYVEYLQTNGHL
ncbi:hypothetical protein [Faecalispora jeddahensis]|uniref:hypothetical protein n=1 Tax=Faecalispora jeddahensis TaxID=1414721 RepID=UPI0028B22A66|nr:hypothetical protein [Faecalispora jeddahensis]